MLAAPTQQPLKDISPIESGGTRLIKGNRPRRLIVNADDLGLSRGITNGILLSHLKGIVSSASLMVNQPATEYAVRCLHDEVRTLDIGIHLNLCQGRPVLPPSSVPSLVRSDGHFLPPPEMARRLVRWQVAAKEIEAEFRAQIDCMLSYGLTPSHADSHHRFHIYPAAVLAFGRAIRSRGIFRVRSAKKKTWPEQGFGSAHAGSFYRRVTVNAYNYVLQRALFQGLKAPDAGVALHPRFRGKLSELPNAWCFAFENMPPGTYEIWCHPGFPEKGFSQTDPLYAQREVELALLTDPRLSEKIKLTGIELVNFKAL